MATAVERAVYTELARRATTSADLSSCVPYLTVKPGAGYPRALSHEHVLTHYSRRAPVELVITLVALAAEQRSLIELAKDRRKTVRDQILRRDDLTAQTLQRLIDDQSALEQLRPHLRRLVRTGQLTVTDLRQLAQAHDSTHWIVADALHDTVPTAQHTPLVDELVDVVLSGRGAPGNRNGILNRLVALHDLPQELYILAINEGTPQAAELAVRNRSTSSEVVRCVRYSPALYRSPFLPAVIRLLSEAGTQIDARRLVGQVSNLDGSGLTPTAGQFVDAHATALVSGSAAAPRQMFAPGWDDLDS